jgi:methylamine dehydrogenase accessory protein MauD
MQEALIISNIVLWLVVLALVVIVLALSRQIGVLYERIAPMGALMIDQGPKVGDASPVMTLAAIAGGEVQVGVARARSHLLFFLSPTCPICKKLLPILKSIRTAEKDWLDIVFASDGDLPEHLAFYRSAGLTDFPYVLSSELAIAFRVGKLPYAVLIDETGHVRAKGLINSREHLESLFTAKEAGVASVQEFIDHANAPAHVPRSAS